MTVVETAKNLDLEDRLQIIELYHRYALAYDEADSDLLRTCFVTDANFQCGVPDHPLLESFDEINQRMHARHEERNFKERHLTTNIVIRHCDGSRAEVSAVAAVFVSAEGKAPELEMTGRYDDELVTEKGAWLFKYRSFKPDANPRVIR